jgi:DDE superfamily endonuclease
MDLYLRCRLSRTRGGAAPILPHVNADAMNLHLMEISTQVAPGAVVTLDGAGWHQRGGKLKVPDNISLLPLPPYSPELNPQENVWQFLRQNYLANRVFETYTALVDACCEAWNALVATPDRITSIASREWAKAVNA